jgi:predicted GH43/DUF377 family glycosyl hydrolase
MSAWRRHVADAARTLVGVEWKREGQVLPTPGKTDPDTVRASAPWVIEAENALLRMWYTGHDGFSSRIVEAVKRPDQPWTRVGVAIEPGLSGETDAYGVESPSVVPVPGGYLMAYGGSDGYNTRLHIATSRDGQSWDAQGTVMHRGAEDAVEATDPCLLVTGSQWWLFYSGYAGSQDASRASILAATSVSGASWDRIGAVLHSSADKAVVSHPCVIDISRTYYMFYEHDDGFGSAIAMATSRDGASWEPRGVTLTASGAGPDGLSVHSPCVVRLRDGTVRMYYGGRAIGDERLTYRICSAVFPSYWPT